MKQTALVDINREVIENFDKESPSITGQHHDERVNIRAVGK